MKVKITQALVERVAPAENGKTTLYADLELRGFYLIISKTKKGFYVQSLVNGKQVRVKLGDHPSLTAKAARELAMQKLVSMRSGANPNEEKRKARVKGMTLRQAMEMHLAAKKLSARTDEGYRYLMSQYLSDWLDKPLMDIGANRASVRERHKSITTKNGAPVADGTFRVFRALYNRGLREHPDLPPNPATNIDFHGLKRRKVEASANQLKEWGRAVLQLNPVRRDLHLFLLLSGMRKTAACESRLEHIHDGFIHIPNPKGGAERAFDLPLSGPLKALLAHRAVHSPRMHRKQPWVFASDSKSGHVSEVKQPELNGLAGHALRHLYASLAVQAGVPLLELKYLLNHAANNVTMGYINIGVEHLRPYQEKASSYILAALGLEWTEGTWPPTAMDAQSAAETQQPGLPRQPVLHVVPNTLTHSSPDQTEAVTAA